MFRWSSCDLPQYPGPEGMVNRINRIAQAEARAELKDFCPVTLVETGKLVKVRDADAAG